MAIAKVIVSGLPSRVQLDHVQPRVLLAELAARPFVLNAGVFLNLLNLAAVVAEDVHDGS
jgi:hypothetical protein